MTRWAADIDPAAPWAEYPRPQMVRPEWLNLNGIWGYAIAPKEQLIESDMHGEILVPFPLESTLSGVGRELGSEERLWYQRKFRIPATWRGGRTLLHFGAVDWETRVFVNRQPIGEHSGGFLPFSFDITEALVPGENELLVSVWDPTDDYWQQRGKQVRQPKTIWYTAVSGIWQTVWLEAVPQVYITGLKITPDIDAGTVRVRVDCSHQQVAVRVRVMDGGRLVGEGCTDHSRHDIDIPIPEAKLWDPDHPHLYDLEAEAGDDRVRGYFGMRKFGVEGGRLCLNHEPLFQYGPLDQGYWPDGLYTPPSDAAMQADIELVKRLGCNMLRKHVKVEPARFYYHCDRIGLIVWQDLPNGGSPANETALFLLNLFGIRTNDRDYRRAGRAQPESRQDLKRELQEMVEALYDFPCIGMWVPFNEAWGQFDARMIADWLKDFDPTRPVDHASGWFDQGGGDCDSLHVYFRKLKTKKAKRRAVVLSEFGGYSLKVDGHLWNDEADFGYKRFTSREALTEGYVSLVEKELLPWVRRGLSAAVYTQLTDVENEVNGYVTYDRAVEKMDLSRLAALHQTLFERH